MKRLWIGLLSVLLAAGLQAAETDTPKAPATTGQAPAARAAKEAQDGAAKAKRKVVGYPFRGKVGAIDAENWTLTVVTKNTKRVLPVSRQAKILRAGKPVKLSDGKVGEEVAGYIRKLEGDRIEVTTIRFGPKEPAKNEEAPKPAASKEAQAGKE